MKKHPLLLIATLLSATTSSYALTTTQPVEFTNDTVGSYTKDNFEDDWLTYMYSSQKENLYIANLDASNTTAASSSSKKTKNKHERQHQQSKKPKAATASNNHGNTFQVKYPAMKVGGSAGVAIPVPLSSDLSTISYNHLVLQYDVMFPADFTPPPDGGGKLPGLASDKDESGCVDNTPGFSSRYMWRDDTMKMYLYLYHPTKIEDCGDYIELDTPYYFPKGEWVTLTQEVKLNESGKSNGYIRIWVNGIQKLEKTGLKLIADGENLHIDYAQIDAFPGGSDVNQWGFKEDGNATYFDNFVVSEDSPIAAPASVTSKKRWHQRK